MKILEIRAAGLRGRTPTCGWSNELKPGDCVQTLIAVLTDEGEVGWGSAFTNDELVRGALAVLRPFYEGENALEPERVNELLHQNTFWLGRGDFPVATRRDWQVRRTGGLESLPTCFA